MIVKIQYISFLGITKSILPDPPEGFPSHINIIKFAHLGENIAIARSMGEHIRDKKLSMPPGILFEKAPR